MKRLLTFEQKQSMRRWLDILLAVNSVIAIGAFIAVIGFYLNDNHLNLLQNIIDLTLAVFVVQEAIRWLGATNFRQYLRTRLLENIFSLLLLLHFIFPDAGTTAIQYVFPMFTIKNITIIYLVIVQFSFFNVLFIKLLRYNFLFSKINLHPGAIFSLSFAIIILIGTLLLMLPRASSTYVPLSFIDSLFTSTSAVCVTGLIVVDTASAFSPLGKMIILVLIQIGGLGVMTLTTFFAALFAGGISFHVRVMMKDLLSQENIGTVKQLLKKIFLYTIIIEIVGAIVLYASLGGSFLMLDHEKLYSAVFHSVSAFCNAGFSLYPDSMMNTAVAGNYSYISTIMILIVLGGLGFSVLANITHFRAGERKKKRLKYRFTLNTKVVVITSVILIISGFVVISLVEPYQWNNTLNSGEKLYHSLFQSVTARTAGFNTVPIETLTPVAAITIIFLMWIGASPGSTGGGIKTTTFAVACMALFRHITGNERLELFHRQIEPNVITRSFLVLFASLIVFFVGLVAMLLLEPDKSLLDLAFEVASAINTVGLSRNVTFFIGTGGKVVIILLMFIGRIGVLTFFLSFYQPNPPAHYTLPKEGVVIG